ncbi:MAG: VWA domain-containing protein [Gammaproteobacteria bacterium]|nr:VWA domain-containing protein [Gammaproteobacteria bacterium]
MVLPLSGSGQAVHAAIQTLAPSGGTSCVSCGLRLANDVFADSTRDGQATLGRLALLFTDDAPGNELPVDYVPAYTALHKTGVTLLGIALPGIPTADRNALANATNVVASSGFADVYDLGDGPGALYQSILALVGFPTVDYSLHLSTGTVFGSVAVAADGSFALPTVAVAEGGTFWSLQATNRLGATISRGATVYATPVPLPPGALLMLAPLAALARPARQPNAARY